MTEFEKRVVDMTELVYKMLVFLVVIMVVIFLVYSFIYMNYDNTNKEKNSNSYKLKNKMIGTLNLFINGSIIIISIAITHEIGLFASDLKNEMIKSNSIESYHDML